MVRVKDILRSMRAVSKPIPVSEKRTYTVAEIRSILRISLPTTYALIRENLFQSVKVGRGIRISKQSFDEWLCAGLNKGGGTHG